MNKEQDRPEVIEGKVTYTYDDNDRLLYRNVYEGDRIGRSTLFADSASFSRQDKPKKLLYQDVYLYNNNGLSDIKRIYQPTIDIMGVRNDNDAAVITAHITCRSKVLCSGFIYNDDLNPDKESILKKFLYPSRLLSNSQFRGRRAVGTIQTTIPNNVLLHVKAYAMMETGTLFSKTLTIDPV
jgi:hypothetical protein